MATVRLKTKEVQVDSTIYKFDAVWKADAFEANLAVADVEHCVKEHQPIETCKVEHDLQLPMATSEESSAEEI